MVSDIRAPQAPAGSREGLSPLSSEYHSLHVDIRAA